MKTDAKQIDRLAAEVLSISKAQLLVQMRFLDRALYELKPCLNEQYHLATDGRHLFYMSSPLLNAYRKEQGYPVRVWFHMLIHCLFRHMFVSIAVDAEKWDLACDLAAEAIISDLNLRQIKILSNQSEREDILNGLKNEVRLLNAERIYRYLLDTPISEEKMQKWRELFQVDSHKLWHIYFAHISINLSTSGNSKTNRSGPTVLSLNTPEWTEVQNMWKDIAEQIQVDLECFSQRPGTDPGDLVQLLRDVNREKCDYRSFLKRFATKTEVMKISPDEFDYVLYTYGLGMYKDMPLIEPLEYREDLRIREFVIAIDTSGSVAGDLVQMFLQKTFTILKQEETFDRKFHLHIIQCDADIQQDTLITTQEEFDYYLQHLTIKGLGGTDFRPVFEHIEQLQKKNELQHLKGMLYFTDGYGTYPVKPTDYQTAFVFVEDEIANRWVPPWAIRIQLTMDEIRQTEPT